MKIDDLFTIEYPHTLIYSELSPNNNGINFVSSQGVNNSVVGRVAPVDGVKIYPAGVITVPLKGTVLAAHVQVEPCYVAHQIAVLTAKKPMNIQEKLFYCTCIQNNAYRFSYGRQADKTLKNIELPDSIPEWVNSTSVRPISTNNSVSTRPIEYERFKDFPLADVFEVKYGINLELLNCTVASDDDPTAINFVARTAQNNGVVAKVKRIQGLEPQPAGILTCAGGGSVLSTFVQSSPFYSGRDLYLLIPKYPMSLSAKLFCCTIIEANKYRFSYGRQANKTLPTIQLKLPAKADGTPDFEHMENYIKSLPYGDRI
ncbi:MAG: restriction endonuclease subunit S [Clostridia bacterium]|nr:restriction endonuclease subunit S [Clostridia bacterium]